MYQHIELSHEIHSPHVFALWSRALDRYGEALHSWRNNWFLRLLGQFLIFCRFQGMGIFGTVLWCRYVYSGSDAISDGLVENFHVWTANAVIFYEHALVSLGASSFLTDLWFRWVLMKLYGNHQTVPKVQMLISDMYQQCRTAPKDMMRF